MQSLFSRASFSKFALWSIALAVRVPLLFAPLWYDEAFTVLTSKRPFVEMLVATAGDVHPPLYYAIVWPLFALMPTAPDWIARLPALVFGLLSIWLAAKVARDIGMSERATVWSQWGLALLPFHIHYSTEARMYTLLLALFLAALYFARRERLVELALCISGIFYTHYVGPAYVSVVGIYFFWPLMRDLDIHNPLSVVGKWWLSMVVAVLLYMPWIPILLTRTSDIQTNWWKQPVMPGDVISTFVELLWSHAFRVGLAPMVIIPFTVALLIVAGYSAFKSLPEGRLILILAAAIPVGLLLASWLYRPVLITRAAIGASPFLVMVLAIGADNITSKQTQRFVVMAIAPLFVVGSVLISFTDWNIKAASYEVVSLLQSQFRVGDIIMHANPGSWVPFSERGIGDNALLPQTWPIKGTLSTQTLNGLGAVVIPFETAQTEHERVWLLQISGSMVSTDEDKALAEIVQAHDGTTIYALDDVTNVTTVRLWLFEGSEK